MTQKHSSPFDASTTDFDLPLPGQLRLPKGMTGLSMQQFIDEGDYGAYVGHDGLIYGVTKQLLYTMYVQRWDVFWES